MIKPEPHKLIAEAILAQLSPDEMAVAIDGLRNDPAIVENIFDVLASRGFREITDAICPPDTALTKGQKTSSEGLPLGNQFHWSDNENNSD